MPFEIDIVKLANNHPKECRYEKNLFLNQVK